MTESYVGVVTHLGLEQLWLEGEHTWQFVLRRTQRLRARPACGIWAVLDRAFEEQIAVQIHLGHRLDALLLLQAVAVDLGRIYAEPYETVLDVR